MVLTHAKTIDNIWFEALWDGDAMCAFMLDDEPHQAIRANDLLIMQDSHSNRRMKGIISHIYNGIDFVDPEMICVSFSSIAKLFDKESISPTNDPTTICGCYICHHAYPALKLCSRCGPQCAACQQAHDAARYRWICEQMTAKAPHIDGTALWSLSFTTLPRARSATEAVDIAMREGEK